MSVMGERVRVNELKREHGDSYICNSMQWKI
jgi:hypothetical protein